MSIIFLTMAESWLLSSPSPKPNPSLFTPPCKPFSNPFPLLTSLMARYSFLLALLLLLFVIVASATDDILIRQVVPDAFSEAAEKEDENHLLNAEHHFASFKAKFEKKYATKEVHNRRFDVFKSNLRKVRCMPSSTSLPSMMSTNCPISLRQFLSLKPLRFSVNAHKALKDFDWRDKGAIIFAFKDNLVRT